jgi:outer membrane lipoprotein carrier protein
MEGNPGLLNASVHSQRSGALLRPVYIILLAAQVSFSGVSVPASSQDQLIQAVQDRYNHAKTLSVQFWETFSMQGHSRPPESGLLTLRKQGKMRWDYTVPHGKLFVSDGKNVFLYTARDNRVEKIPLKDTEDMRAPLAFLLGHMDFKKEFRDCKMEAGSAGSWLECSARTSDLPYTSVRMSIRPDGEISELAVVGRDGSSLGFRFRDEVLNPSAPDSLFHFTPPPGATVVDAVEYGRDSVQ